MRKEKHYNKTAMVPRSGAGKNKTVIFLLLTVGLSFLLSPVALAALPALTPCQPGWTVGHLEKMAPSDGSCRCCRNEKGARKCCCDVKAGCNPAGHVSAVSASNVESPATGFGPAFASPSPAHYGGEDAPKDAPARETTYLVNLNLLC